MGLSLLFVLIVLCHSLDCVVRDKQLGSPSECRCRSAIQYGLTDEPPFDGKSVVLKFSEDYNVTELEETVLFLGPTLVVSYDFGCAERIRCRKQEEEEKVIEQKKEEQRARILREKIDSFNVLEKCEEYEKEIEAENAKKWWWQEKIQPIERANGCCVCRQTKLVEEEWEWEYEMHHPCKEVGCDHVTRRCVDMSQFYRGPPGWVPPCVYSIRLKTN